MRHGGPPLSRPEIKRFKNDFEISKKIPLAFSSPNVTPPIALPKGQGNTGKCQVGLGCTFLRVNNLFP